MSEYASATATLVAGMVTPIVVQFIKVRLKWHDFKAYLLTLFTSSVLAVGVLVYTGDITSVRAIVLQLPAVFGVATIIYRTISYGMQTAEVQ